LGKFGLTSEDGVTGDPTAGLGSMFNDPQLIQKLAQNPKTSKFLADPTFMAKLSQMQKNPTGSQDIFSDPRMIQVLGVLMGVDMDMMGGGMPGGPGGAESAPREAEEDMPMPDAPSAPKQTPAPKREPTPEPEPEPEDDEAAEKAKAKAAAEEEKKLGTENYKKRNFDQAITHYSKAWELYKDITYLNNLGAAYFEKGDYEEAVKACEKAVEEGREIYADFKTIAKSYARIGSSYEKLGDLAKAVENFQKSLTEHRTPEVVNKLRAAEKNKIESARQAYIDPEKAEEARELGNQKFKDADWPAAVAAYSEMVKRAPEDPRGYSNRAAAFIKLLEFPSAIDDCNLAIKKDPKFVRAYLRKAQAYFGMRDYSKCLDACTDATEADTTKANAREIEQQQQKALSAMYSSRENETEEQTKERIQRDPEVCPFPNTHIHNLLTSRIDPQHHARSSHAIHPPTSSRRPSRSPGTHEESRYPEQDSEADCQRHHSGWSMNEIISQMKNRQGDTIGIAFDVL
jgi:stress-induced-phosphoprotein 1